MPRLSVRDYVRVIDRTPAESVPEDVHGDISSDDIPFAWLLPLILAGSLLGLVA
jgi:hypothetical protein